MSMNLILPAFRNAPAPATLELLREHCASVEQVFETSYDICAEMSAASFKHLLKSQAPTEEYNLVKVKKASECSPRLKNPSGSE